jgi:hypothetical protein
MINRIFADLDIPVFYDSLEKILPGEGKVENDGKHSQWGSAFCFGNA